MEANRCSVSADGELFMAHLPSFQSGGGGSREPPPHSWGERLRAEGACSVGSGKLCPGAVMFWSRRTVAGPPGS